jgi:tetratricopeptide (TPR) repeat protein
MILATITMTSNRENIIGDALRSVVGFADLCILVDLGITDNTVRVAREIVGDKLRVVKYQEVPSPRNFGLDAAAEMGADWACTLDTDERMHFDGVDIKDALEKIGAGTVLVPHDSGCYCKERFFKLPALDKFIGYVHECVPPVNTPQVYMNGVCFSELPKSAELAHEKAESIVDSLTKSTEEDPGNPRWWYYLGGTLSTLGRLDEALHAFQACAELNGWDEESAWACFRAATILAEQHQPFEAIETCAKGLARYPAMAELAWLAGEIAFAGAQYGKAIYWARMAVANGINDGEHTIRPRIGYRHVFGLTAGPYYLMVKAYNALGMTAEKESCEKVLNRLNAKEADHA